MRVASAAILLLGVLAACDQLNKPMAVPSGTINPPGSASGSSSGSADAGSDGALAPLPPPGPGQPVVQPQPGDTQL